MIKIRLNDYLIKALLLSVFILLPVSSIAGIVDLFPSLRIGTEYEDNIRFRRNSNDADDDFAARAIPSIGLNYTTELFKFNSLAEIDVKRYFNQTDYDRTNQFYYIGAEYRARPRWTLFTNGYYRKDETVDSQYEETGRVFERNRRKRYESQGGVRYNLTELTDIGTTFTYLRADFSSEYDDDYDRYTIELPYRKKFKNQIDMLMFTPAYSHYNSDDNEEADDFRSTIGWEHLINELLTFDVEVGPRYTETKSKDGTNNNRFGAVGRIGLVKRGETFKGEIRYSHDLRPTTRGELVNVDRLFVYADKRLTERFGFRFDGSAYHSNRDNTDKPDDEVISFQLTPALFYMLTTNHSVELSYRYRRQVELDEPGNPTRNQNVVALQLILSFPKRWD